MEIKKRNSSIELLRIIAEIGVILLHYNNSGQAFDLVQDHSLNWYSLYFTESFFICAVNLFIIISSFYLSSTNKRKLSKVAEFLIEVVFFRLLTYCLSVFVTGELFFNWKRLIECFFPVNYFVILYSTLYILSPYLNTLLDKLNIVQIKRLLLISFILFSIETFMVDILNHFGNYNGMSTIGIHGSQEGYTIVNFILLYIFGYSIRKGILNINTKSAFFGSLLCILIIYITVIFGGGQAWNYNNPLVIINAICIFSLFNNFQFYNKYINEISKSAFTCFLFHNFFLDKCHISNYVNGNLIHLWLHQLICSIGLYLVSYLVYKLYHFMSRRLYSKLKFLDNFDIYLFE